MKVQAQFLTTVFSRKFSTSWKFYAKLEVLPKRSLVDERLQTTIISNLKPHSSGAIINYPTITQYLIDSNFVYVLKMEYGRNFGLKFQLA